MTKTLHFLKEEVGANMLARLEWVTLQPQRILILGGDKQVEKKLQERFSDAEWIEEGILNEGGPPVDLIFANLVLPHCADHKKILMQWQKWIKPNGLCFFSSLGPDTLKEFPSHLLTIHRKDMHEIGDELVQAHFSDPVLDVEEICVTYQDIDKMKEDLCSMQFMINTEIEPFLAGKSTTYEVIYGHAWVAEKKSSDDTGVVKIPLSHLRRR